MIEDDRGAIDYAENGAGPTVVLVPGSCSTGAAWRPVLSALATAFWVGIDSGLAPSVECSLHAGFSEQHRPPIFGGVDQHLYSQTPFRLIAFRFGEPPNIIAGISQCSCRRAPGQRYGLAKWTIPRHKTSLHNGIPSGAGAQRNGPSGG